MGRDNFSKVKIKYLAKKTFPFEDGLDTVFFFLTFFLTERRMRKKKNINETEIFSEGIFSRSI